MRLPDTFTCRVCATVVAALATVVSPAVGAGQAAQNQGGRDQVGARNLEPGAARDPAPSRPAGVPRGYALVIGVGDYPNLDERQQLPFAESDAREMRRVLINPEGGAFWPENVRFLTGEDASLANIRQALEEWLPSVAQPDDRVVVYFVGHGFVENGRGYLAPADVDPSRLAETAYPMEALGDVMANRIRARWKALFTDACHSGGIHAETTDEALLQQLGSLPQNFLNFSAARAAELAYYDERLASGFGFFTYFLTRALWGDADNDPCDGEVTADEVVQYVRYNVRQRARQHELYQTPSDRGRFDPRMPLGVNTECLGSDPERAQDGTALVEVNLDDVRVFVGGEFRGTVSGGGPPLEIPGLPAGDHQFRGVRQGYVDAKQTVVIPAGQVVTVNLSFRYRQQSVRPEAQRLNERGERLLHTRRSTRNLMDIYFARSQDRSDLERARDLFAAAVEEDDEYAKAWSNLGHVQQLLGNYQESLDAYGEVIRLDPSDADARVRLAGALVELGDANAAFRQLADAELLEPATDEAYARLARAYLDKDAWEQTVAVARQAIELNDSNSMARLYRAEAVRRLAAGATSSAERQSIFRGAREDYRTFVKLTDFESSLGEKLAFYFIGFGIGRRGHADREDVLRSVRGTAFLGLCIIERILHNPWRAREHCRSAIENNNDSELAYYRLGLVNVDLVDATSDGDEKCGHFAAAERSFMRVIELNPVVDEADASRRALGGLRQYGPQIGCSVPQ